MPYSAVNLLLNLAPIMISFRFIGKKFTLYSCVAIVLTSIFDRHSSRIPDYLGHPFDLCVRRTDQRVCRQSVPVCRRYQRRYGFIAIFFSERKGKEPGTTFWAGNGADAGGGRAFLFSWEQALVFHSFFSSRRPRLLNGLYSRYQKLTLLIITEAPQRVYEQIKEVTHHDATLFQGGGLL